MSTAEDRYYDALDLAREAAEAGVPAAHYAVMPTTGPADEDETAELIEEWRKTCDSQGIPFRMEDAVKFVQDVRR